MRAEKEGRKGDLMINLHDKNKAGRFIKANPKARLGASKNKTGRIYIQTPAELLCVEHNSVDLRLQISTPNTAKHRRKLPILGKSDEQCCEVRLKGRWGEDELKSRLEPETEEQEYVIKKKVDSELDSDVMSDNKWRHLEDTKAAQRSEPANSMIPIFFSEGKVTMRDHTSPIRADILSRKEELVK